jgi:hypothetical protein
MVESTCHFCFANFFNLISSRSPPRSSSSSSLSLANNDAADNEATLAEMACMLIEAGADVNKTDHDHFTPLLYGMLISVFVLKKSSSFFV